MWQIVAMWLAMASWLTELFHCDYKKNTKVNKCAEQSCSSTRFGKKCKIYFTDNHTSAPSVGPGDPVSASFEVRTRTSDNRNPGQNGMSRATRERSWLDGVHTRTSNSWKQILRRVADAIKKVPAYRGDLQDLVLHVKISVLHRYDYQHRHQHQSRYSTPSQRQSHQNDIRRYLRRRKCCCCTRDRRPILDY